MELFNLNKNIVYIVINIIYDAQLHMGSKFIPIIDWETKMENLKLFMTFAVGDHLFVFSRK